MNRTPDPIAVLTGPNGQTTLVAPGQSATVPGQLVRVDTYIVNLSRRQLLGWDFGAHYTRDLAPGRWTLAAAASYTDKNRSAFDRFSPLVSYVGLSSNPRWRGRATLDWECGPWSAGTTFAYTASSGFHTADGGYQKPYRVTHLRATYRTKPDSWLRGAQLSVGLDDIFNETTPLFADPPIGFNYSTVPRPQGRFWRMSVKQTW